MTSKNLVALLAVLIGCAGLMPVWNSVEWRITATVTAIILFLLAEFGKPVGKFAMSLVGTGERANMFMFTCFVGVSLVTIVTGSL